MAVQTYKYIDPQILTSINNLELAAKTVVEGFLIGSHSSQMPGSGMEFSQYRSYQPGDDIRTIDWKLFARSDRYYIRESEIETNITVRIIVDATKSMAFSEKGVSKLNYALLTAASLLWLANKQGDAIALETISDNKVETFNTRREALQIHRLLYALENVSPKGTWPTEYSIEPEHKELIIFISDFYEKHDEMKTLLGKFSALKNDVIMMHIIGEEEQTFPYSGYLRFKDLEEGETVEVDTKQVREEYIQSYQKGLEQIRFQMLEKKIDYERFLLNEPIDLSLQSYLSKRVKLF